MYQQMCIRDRYQTISVIFSISNVSLKYLVNNPDDKMIEVVLNTSNNFMLEELQYLLIKKELTIMEDREINENFGAAKWKSWMIRRYITRTEINMDTKMSRGNRATRVIDHS